MPAGVPVLGSSGSDRQLVGEDLENSNAGSRHARQGGPDPRHPPSPLCDVSGHASHVSRDITPPSPLEPAGPLGKRLRGLTRGRRRRSVAVSERPVLKRDGPMPVS
jgi:hypothetical protein